MTKKLRILSVLSLTLILGACGKGSIGGVTHPKVSVNPTATPIAPALPTGKTLEEKALSIAKIVSQEHQDILIVIDGRFVQNDMIVMSPDSNGKIRFQPEWLVDEEGSPQDVGKVGGLSYLVAVTKTGKTITADDMGEVAKASAELVSLSAKYIVPNDAQKDAKGFSFVDVVIFLSSKLLQETPVAVRTVDIIGVHISLSDIRAEKAKGDAADWKGLVASHNAPLFPYIVPST